jgi:hypothetical protein
MRDWVVGVVASQQLFASQQQPASHHDASSLSARSVVGA